MESAYMHTDLNVFTDIHPVARQAVRLSVGYSLEDQRYTLLCIYRAKGAILAELVLTEAERLELIERLVDAAPRRPWPPDEEQDDEPDGELA